MKTKFKTSRIIFLFLFLSAFVLQAQKNAFEKGTIILSKKKSVEAYILIDFTRPQNFQKEVTYLEPKAYAKFKAGKKAKKLTETVKAKEIVGFDLDDGRKFRTVKYMDLTSGGMGAMMPKKLCMQQIINGKVDMYKLYQHTGSTGSVGISKVSNVVSQVAHESRKTNNPQLLIDHIQSNFQLLAQKEHKMPKNVYSMNMANLIGDNPAVKENYENNKYGVQAYITGDIIPGLLAHENIEAAFLKMITDYNSDIKMAK